MAQKFELFLKRLSTQILYENDIFLKWFSNTVTLCDSLFRVYMCSIDYY